MAEISQTITIRNGLPSSENVQCSSLLPGLVLSCCCKEKKEIITYQFYNIDKLGLFMYSYQIRILP